jgi:hypothetical protein
VISQSGPEYKTGISSNSGKLIARVDRRACISAERDGDFDWEQADALALGNLAKAA